jgi:hypothetical protein
VLYLGGWEFLIRQKNDGAVSQGMLLSGSWAVQRRLCFADLMNAASIL